MPAVDVFQEQVVLLVGRADPSDAAGQVAVGTIDPCQIAARREAACIHPPGKAGLALRTNRLVGPVFHTAEACSCQFVVKRRVFRYIDSHALFRPPADIGAVRPHAEPHLERRQM